MVHKRDHEFPEFGRAIFPRQHCAGIGDLGFVSARYRPRLDRLRLFDCDRGALAGGQLDLPFDRGSSRGKTVSSSP